MGLLRGHYWRFQEVILSCATCPVLRGMFSSISGYYSLDASAPYPRPWLSQPSLPVSLGAQLS